MTFEEFWKENYEKEFGTSEPYYGIASYAFEKGQENCNCVYTDNSKVVERLEKENAELKADNDARKFAMVMSEKVEKQLREENAELRKVAEFGYNKANEWHYVNWRYFADKDCPKSELALYLVRLRNKDVFICEWETEEGFGCFWDSNLEPIDNDDIYAWKEIVLPKEE